MFDGARALLALGYDPMTVVRARHAGSEIVAMRGVLGDLAYGPSRNATEVDRAKFCGSRTEWLVSPTAGHRQRSRKPATMERCSQARRALATIMRGLPERETPAPHDRPARGSGVPLIGWHDLVLRRPAAPATRTIA